ncbi:MAG: OprD family outer membrane porin [Verrucomicrobiota bacterium]
MITHPFKSTVNRLAPLRECACAAVASLAALGCATTAAAQQASTPAPTRDDATGAEAAMSSVEQGRTPIEGSYEEWRQWRLEKRQEAFKDTKVQFNLRTYYFDRNMFDGSESEAWAIGGWAGVKTGYFFDHLALAVTGYTSQPLYAPDNKDGTLLLKPGQEPYSVLGELYGDIRITDESHIYAGRKGYDTPYINRNDTRMTPNTFDAYVLQGQAELDGGWGTLKYGFGYFDSIKERNADEFVSMSVDAGATVKRGVVTAGGLYQNGGFSFGAIDYYCADIINIGYAEAKMEFPLGGDWKLRLAAQFSDQCSIGDNLLTGESFSAHQFGLKAELPVGRALFTAAYTAAGGDANMRSPWSGYPGYTSVQVQDFNRKGEDAFLLRAGYEFAGVEGLGAYVLGVLGTSPGEAGQYRQDECDFNLQWVPPNGCLKGLALRLRYAVVEQHGGNVDNLTDFRVTCNYTYHF